MLPRPMGPPGVQRWQKSELLQWKMQGGSFNICTNSRHMRLKHAHMYCTYLRPELRLLWMSTSQRREFGHTHIPQRQMVGMPPSNDLLWHSVQVHILHCVPVLSISAHWTRINTQHIHTRLSLNHSLNRERPPRGRRRQTPSTCQLLGPSTSYGEFEEPPKHGQNRPNLRPPHSRATLAI